MGHSPEAQQCSNEKVSSNGYGVITQLAQSFAP
jgi:hypothetical protein